MLFKKQNSKDKVLNEAINFIKGQLKILKTNKKRNDTDTWINLYKNILKNLKIMRK